MFKDVSPKQIFPELEEEILKFWQEKKIFQKSLEKNSSSAKDKKFVFYEGPPTANGKPGIHHVLARAFKDIICRFKTMQGFKVKRRAGWDTHGLPVEIEVEKSLGISGRKEIEKYGVARFNQKCRQSTWKYKNDWEALTERIGFWLDLSHPYITYENSYIEKVWGVLKEIWDRGLIYQDYKVVPYCPRCETALSSHEVAQGYRQIKEQSIYVKFPLKDEKETYFLVWTTTPWTLPGNAALAINSEIDYVKVKTGNDNLILAKERTQVLSGDFEIVAELKGKDLVGKKYQPLFEISEILKITERDYQVYAGDFVSDADGTGIVHIAPAFGIDDLELAQKNNLSVPMTVDNSGKMLTKITKDQFVKDADKEIVAELTSKKLFYKEEEIVHEYPFCWRCDSLLIYLAQTNWFIATSKIKDKLLKNNQDINWVPAYIKSGRFGEWLKDVRDWTLSRQRFWGTPLPIWQCQIGKSQISNFKSQNQCKNTIMVGSIAELEKLAITPIDKKNLDLHKPQIDEIFLKCPQCGNKMKRVPEVIDVWFDSGAMPFASGEYPDNFPADYISEAIDQTRGWFFTLLTISTLLEKGAPYGNVICLAHVLDKAGKKMSKSKGNVIDPLEIINQFGSDSLRWYFYSVNGPGEAKKMSAEDIAQVSRKFLLILWNIYSFFISFAGLDKWQPKENHQSQNILDRWILVRLNQLIKNTTVNLDKYNVTAPAREIHDFISDLSTWYLRRSRRRRNDDFYHTLNYVLLTLAKILAPFAPFIAETIFANLRSQKDSESVHLCDWPKSQDIDKNLIDQMEKVRKLSELAHAERSENKIRNRQPLNLATINTDLSEELLEILKDEINVKKIEFKKSQKEDIILDLKITEQLKKEGIYRDLCRQIQGLRKKANLKTGQPAKLYFQTQGVVLEILQNQRAKIQKETNVSLISEKNPDVKITSEYSIEQENLWLGISQ